MEMKRTSHILLILPELEQSGLLQDALRSAGYFIAVASTIEEALVHLDTQSFDLLIGDIALANRSDEDFFFLIRKKYADLRIILITGSDQPTGMKPVAVDHIIARPFRISHIEEIIGDLLGASGDKTSTSTHGILIVDDDDTFRIMLIRSLRLAGHSVYGATDGEMALDILNRGGIGTVIADVHMPSMDGIALLKKVKNKWPRIVVILITGYYSSEESLSVDAIKPDGFLMKPFRIQSITDLLHSLSLKPPSS